MPLGFVSGSFSSGSSNAFASTYTISMSTSSPDSGNSFNFSSPSFCVGNHFLISFIISDDNVTPVTKVLDTDVLQNVASDFNGWFYYEKERK